MARKKKSEPKVCSGLKSSCNGTCHVSGDGCLNRLPPTTPSDSLAKDERVQCHPTKKSTRYQLRHGRGLGCPKDEDEVVDASRDKGSDGTPKSLGITNKPSKLATELAKIADYNAPPAPASDRYRTKNETEDNVSGSEKVPEVIPKATRKTRKTVVKKSKSQRKHRESELAAELEDRADLQEPIVPQSRRQRKHLDVEDDITDCDYTPKQTSRAIRRSRRLAVKNGSSVVRSPSTPDLKSKPKQKSSNRLLAELENLAPWHDWVKKDRRMSQYQIDGDEPDEVEDSSPKHHQRDHPPREPGVQNIGWCEIPGEIRNLIYTHVLACEAETMPTLTRYPRGLPRRTTRGFGSSSSPNFPQSSWGFTQTSRQIRKELMPWLLTTRRVRTRLATVNKYVDVFHPLEADGSRVGWIELFCDGVALGVQGVEVLRVLDQDNATPGFHLQLEPTPRALSMRRESDLFRGAPELQLMRNLNKPYAAWTGEWFDHAGIKGLRIASLPKRCGDFVAGDEEEDEDEDNVEDSCMQDLLVKLDVDKSLPAGKGKRRSYRQLHAIQNFIKMSGLCSERGLNIQARLHGGVARWKVGSNLMLSGSWMEYNPKGVGWPVRMRTVQAVPLASLPEGSSVPVRKF